MNGTMMSIMRIGRQAVWLVVCALCLGCSASETEPDGALRVLFVGNSLTYTNDLPGVVAAFGAAAEEPLVVETVAFPNASLENHWYGGEAREALASARWDVVVLQQGPSSLPENQAHLRTWTARFADEARTHGTEPALYMVWPSDARRGAFPAVVASYTQAAEAASAALLPAGAAWLAAWDAHPAFAPTGPTVFTRVKKGRTSRRSSSTAGSRALRSTACRPG
jgi:hypothetical protein